jgi:alkylhydroperoxidase family enzyme
MAYIETTPPEESQGLLKRIYDAAIERAGRIWNVIRLQSINPPALQSSLELYKSLMHGRSPLSRAQREMIAVVVSQANDCFY